MKLPQKKRLIRIAWLVVLITVLHFQVKLYRSLALPAPLGKDISTFSDTSIFPDTFNFSDTSELPSIAYSFNGYHGDFLSIPATLAAVFHPRNVYGILVDASISAPEVKKLQSLIVQAVLQQHPKMSCTKPACVESRIFVRTGDFSVTYGGISEPLATLDAMAMLLEFDDNWEFFINLTPVDYPLASQQDISRLLASVRGLSFMGLYQLGIVHASDRFEKRWHSLYHDPSLLRIRDRKGDRQQLTKLSGNLPKNIVDSPLLRVFQSEAYCVLDRSFCQHAINSPLARRSIALLSNGFASSEQLISTILGNSKGYGMCPSSLRMNNVGGGPRIKMRVGWFSSSAHVIKAVRQMASTGLLFARKFPRVCVKSHDHCQQAYNNEPYRTAVFASLVRDDNLMNSTYQYLHTNTTSQQPPLQQVWRAAATAKFQELIPKCRQPSR